VDRRAAGPRRWAWLDLPPPHHQAVHRHSWPLRLSDRDGPTAQGESRCRGPGPLCQPRRASPTRVAEARRDHPARLRVPPARSAASALMAKATDSSGLTGRSAADPAPVCRSEGAPWTMPVCCVKHVRSAVCCAAPRVERPGFTGV